MHYFTTKLFCLIIFYPYTTVREGGALFEVYLAMFAPMATSTMIIKLVKHRRVANLPASTPMDPAQNSELMAKFLNRYYGFLIYWMNSVCVRTQKQTFGFTYAMDFYGLSRSGQNILSDFGYGFPLRSHDSQKRRAVNSCNIRLS